MISNSLIKYSNLFTVKIKSILTHLIYPSLLCYQSLPHPLPLTFSMWEVEDEVDIYSTKDASDMELT